MNEVIAKIGKFLAIVALHVLHGPLLAGAALALALLFLSLADVKIAQEGETESGLLMIVMFLYVFGAIPALLTGIWAAVRVEIRGTYSNAEAATASIVSAIIFWIVLTITGVFRQPPKADDLSLDSLNPAGFIFVLSGVIAALLCRWLLVWAEVITES